MPNQETLTQAKKIGLTWSEASNKTYGHTNKLGANGGEGFISGTIPGIVTVNGLPASREVEIRLRGENRKVVATTWSSAVDGTYKFDLIDFTKEYDVIARDYNRVYSDIIIPAVLPWAYKITPRYSFPAYVSKSSSATREIIGGSPPYTLDVTTPVSGSTVELNDRNVLINVGSSPAYGVLEFNIEDSLAESKSFSVVVDSGNIAIAWRVRATAANSHFSCCEIEMAASPGGPNLCTGGTAISGGDFSGAPSHAKENAFNGVYTSVDATEVWTSNNAQSGWIGYQFPTLTSVAEIRFAPREATYAQYPTTFFIDKLVNGVWIETAAFSTPGASYWKTGVFRQLPTDLTTVILPNFTQSSVYSSTIAGSSDSLCDQRYEGVSGAATNNGSNEWIMADLGEPKVINKVWVAGGWLSSWGNVAPYLNGAVLQYSNDASSWTTVTTISGATDVVPYQVVVNVASVEARYWRLQRSGYLATSEFRFG